MIFNVKCLKEQKNSFCFKVAVRWAAMSAMATSASLLPHHRGILQAPFVESAVRRRLSDASKFEANVIAGMKTVINS